MKHAFMITSAINVDMGVFTPIDRLRQTLLTINSIKAKVPDAKIILIESAPNPLNDRQNAMLLDATDLLIDCTDDTEVKEIYATKEWALANNSKFTRQDIIKNLIEPICFLTALKMCVEDNDFNGIDRVHKISGRYIINDNFKLSRYELLPDRIIIANRQKSQFPLFVNGIDTQYMSRLWSWPTKETDKVINTYTEGLAFIKKCINSGQAYCDMEHMLYKFLPAELITEFAKIGVEGGLAPNGSVVSD
jgi:hypothetical protein